MEMARKSADMTTLNQKMKLRETIQTKLDSKRNEVKAHFLGIRNSKKLEACFFIADEKDVGQEWRSRG